MESAYKSESTVSYCYEVYSNLPRAGEKAYNSGVALFNENENYYRLKLWMIPHQFYMARSRNTDDLRYTIFATQLEGENGEPKFIDPVGWAVISAFDKEFLELRFKFPRQCLYMSLHPKESY